MKKRGRKRQNRILKFIKKILIYLTNNEYHPKHELEADIVFIVINTVALLFGIVLLWGENGGWIPFLVIEYNWALDNMRHNRE